MTTALAVLLLPLLQTQAGPQSFSERCAACHGTDAEGSDHGPKLAGSRRLRARTTEQLRRTIEEGIPSFGMPSFHLPAPELESLAAYIHALNLPAAEANVPGDPVAGGRYFEGQCASCHMVRGTGSAIGPDLSNTARELTVSELRAALLHPEAHITPGYGIVRVALRDGTSVRAFARGRTDFDLQLQEFDGRFRMVSMADAASVQEESASLMKPFSGSPAELRDLIAYLITPRASDLSPVTVNEPHSGDWLTYNGNDSGNRYSPLHLIDTANVNRLAVRWIFPIDHFGVETTPIVAGGIMYVTGPNQAWALDALTGRAIWHYWRPRSTGLVGDASLGTNRGMAILGDRVFMVTDNAHLISLNRITGSLVWEVTMPEEPQHYGSTVAPLIVGDTVIAGVSGGDWGIRGFVACFEASTGKLLWRHWTVPPEPSYLGGSTWLTGAYDPAAGTLFWPTGNPWPDSNDRDRPGDNLYTNSILALDPHTGALKWHYQFTPHDIHDWDATEPPVLADTVYQGASRKLLLHADRNGFFYVLDRLNGKVLLARQFIRRLTWADGIGLDGRPRPVATPSRVMCPADAANWGSAAFSPVTRLYYVLTLEQCRPETDGDRAQKILRAIDIESGRIAWEIPMIGPVSPKTWPGVLGTAGGLLFYGYPNGAFAAADERSGKVLWHFATNVPMKASPMTFLAGGQQFIAVAAGPDILCFGLPAN